MKISCNREELFSAFQTAATVAPTRNPNKPILANVKFEVDEDHSVLMATDREMGIRIHVTDVVSEVTGAAILPVSRFGAILRESSDTTITIETTDSGTIVKGNRSKFKLPCENPDDFPNVEPFDSDRYSEVSQGGLKALIQRTLFATDQESSRYALGGVMLEFHPTQIIAVGTDGKRLAKMLVGSVSIDNHHDVQEMTIVPSRSMQLIERTLTGATGDNIKIAASQNDVRIKTPNATIYSRLVEGRFPKWRGVFPEGREKSIVIDLAVGPAYAALRQASVVASKESQGINFQFGEGELVLSANTAEIGESRVEFPISYSGDLITIKMNHQYVADFLKVLSTDKTITVEIENSESASIFRTDDGFEYVVMPLGLTKQA